MGKIIEKILELMIRAALVTAVTFPFAKALIKAAYAERGYSAVGGEWLSIIIIATALWKLSSYIISDQKSRERQEESEETNEDSIKRAYAQHSGRGSSTVFDNQKLELDEMGQTKSMPQRNRRA